MSEKTVLLMANLDTRGHEFVAFKDLVAESGLHPLLLDFSMEQAPAIAGDIRCEEVARAGGLDIETVRATYPVERKIATDCMIRGARATSTASPTGSRPPCGPPCPSCSTRYATLSAYWGSVGSGSVGGGRRASSWRPSCGSASSSPTTRSCAPRWSPRGSPRCSTSTPTGRATSSASRRSPGRPACCPWMAPPTCTRPRRSSATNMCLMGDVPPTMLSLGTPDEVHEYCSRLIRDLGPTGFILAQGCDIPPGAKPENVAAMISAATG